MTTMMAVRVELPTAMATGAKQAKITQHNWRSYVRLS